MVPMFLVLGVDRRIIEIGNMSATQLLYRAVGATLLPLLAYIALSSDRIRAFSSAPILPARPSNKASSNEIVCRPAATSRTSTRLHSQDGLQQSQHDIIVIGGGSAGLTAAKFAAKFGNSVAIIEGAKLGGDCTW